MSVQNITRRAGPYVGTGLVSAYTFAFKVFRSEDVKVVRSESADASAQDEVLKFGTDYTVKLNANQDEKAGGTVTLVSPLAEGLRLSILSAITPDQQMVLTNHDGMLPTTLNDSADKAIALIQELQELLGRGITVPATSAMSPAELLNELVSAAKDARLSAEEAQRFADVVNVKDFGAVGDGVTDDTAAIQAANNFAQSLGKGLRFTSGVYPAHGLQMTASWDMEGTAKLLFNGSADESCVTCAVDNLSCGSVNIDANAIEVDKLFCVSGNKNHFDSITLLNGKSETILVRMLIVEGNDNFFGSVVGIDHVKGSYWNDSSPQCVCLNGTATGNSFDNIFARNCRSTVVNNATGKNFFGNVYSVDAKDNGFYAVAGSSYIDSIFYDGDDNGVGFRHGANAVINSVNLARIGAYGVFFW